MHARFLIAVFLLAISSFSTVVFAATGPSYEPIANATIERDLKAAAFSSEWLRLLHYRPKLFGEYQSEITTPEFFISRNGKNDPLQELQATLQLALDPQWKERKHPSGGQPTVCAYPARVNYLQRVLDVKTPSFDCPIFQEWASGIAAQSVTLVYSAAYPDNPASMFGHTLLRLNRGQGSTDLLAYGAGFSALIPEDENRFKYAIWGLLGGYTGRYDLTPYHRKVGEYSLSESRDLWEYELPLTHDETSRLVMHLWELYVSGGFDYYFLNKNCSFQLLTLLETVRLDWDLSDGFDLYALPSETLKRVTRYMPDAKVVYRPALRQRMLAQMSTLTKKEQIEILRAAKNPTEVKDAWIEPQSAVDLDALIALLQYRTAKKDSKKNTEGALLMRRVLLARSKKSASENDHPIVMEASPSFHERQRPDRSHGPMRLGLSGGQSEAGGIARFTWTLFSHDLLNSTASYTPYSEIRLMGATVERDPVKPRLVVREVSLVSMQSLADFNAIEPEGSWRMSAGWNRMGWNASGGYGLGYLLKPVRSLAYVLPSVDLGPTISSRPHSRFQFGADMGFTTSLADMPFALDMRASVRSDRGEVYSVPSLAVAVPLSQNLDFRLRGTRTSFYGNELLLEAGWMF